jgi:CRISPR system Cascade subunit CasE
MYLSRLILNERNRDARRDLADCQKLHRTVMAAFPQAPAGHDAREHFGVLHRLDAGRDGHPVLLVQSRAAPDWSRLPAGYLLDSGGQPANPACKSIDGGLDALQPGRELLFRVRANPTRKINTRSGPDGRRSNGTRVELHGEQEWLTWLERKAGQSGFRLLSVRASPAVPDTRVAGLDRITGSRPVANGNGRQRLTFFSVLFEGRLSIADAKLFRAAVEQGIGPGKAYGFGLLSVAPVKAAV